MSDQDETRRIPRQDEPSAETIRFGGAGGSPPEQTRVMHTGGDEPPDGGRRFLIWGLIFLLGLAGGFAIAQLFSGDDERLPPSDLVLFESASTDFPIDGAAFTESTFDQQTGRCDPDLLRQALRADERRFEAWLDLQEISESEFDAFADRLETRILSEPTAVTNHGCFAEGDGPCPFELHSVLAAGTPVWFDPQQDRIVAKCACSNPLKEPQCPPNCLDQPTPTPSATPTPTATFEQTPPPTRTPPPQTEPPTPTPTPEPTPTPTPEPTPTPVITQGPLN